MQQPDTLIMFFFASVILAFTPGPDNLFVLAQSAQRGKKAGIIVTIGLCTGILVHTAAVAFGVAALFQASTIAFSLLKYVGVAYLLYLAYLSFKSGAGHTAQQEVPKVSTLQLYRRGIIMNVTNPKVTIFFLAFLPQFTDPAHGSLVLQFLILGLLFIIATILVFGLISLLAGELGAMLRKSSNAERYLNKLAGTVFVALAVKLALANK